MVNLGFQIVEFFLFVCLILVHLMGKKVELVVFQKWKKAKMKPGW